MLDYINDFNIVAHVIFSNLLLIVPQTQHRTNVINQSTKAVSKETLDVQLSVLLFKLPKGTNNIHTNGAQTIILLSNFIKRTLKMC